MATTIGGKYGIYSMPKSSNASSSDVTGQLVTPQNTAAIPQAAKTGAPNPAICPKRHPKVAPTKRLGIIAPPLYPLHSVITVNIIFSANAAKKTFPSSASTITSMPVPR